MDDWSNVRLCDAVNLLLAVVLFFSPWLFDLSSGAQWQTASTVGLVIAVLSIAALAAFAAWEEWVNLIAGLVLIASPWLLGFQDSQAMTINVVIGMIVAVLAAFEAGFTYLSRAEDEPKIPEPESGC
jgi:SPW repeat